ncbi:MAG: MFS transporter [Planctomycetaceae bacterium]|jgi:sugar phosphate permease|nr:MFS transporter [Planctomycetaceae bacterium]
MSSLSKSRSLEGSRPGENQLIWTVWLTYGAFYFCRTNISAAVPGLSQSTEQGGLGFSTEQVGWILASLKIAYGVGQLVNGQLSERVAPRILLSIGMFSSALLNVAFGLSTGFYFLLFIWAANGYCQSLGWTPCVRVVGNWIPLSRRGWALGVIGTGYQITLGLTYLIASESADRLGWRGALFVPSILLAFSGVVMLWSLRETPPGGRIVESIETSESIETPESIERPGVRETLYLTFYNPTLWLLGLSLGLLNACRYGFLDWGLKHLMEVQQTTIGKAGLKYCVIAVGAAAGSFLAGIATDRLFGGRRAPVVAILLTILGITTLLYESVSRASTTGTVLLLVVIGFCIYGPQVLLVGTAPVDMAHRGTAAAAAGFVNFMGYMGAATGDVVTGIYSSGSEDSWQVTIYIWAGWAFAAALTTGVLWNTTARQVGLLPSWLPKTIALVSLVTAVVTVQIAGGPAWLVAGIVLAVGGMALSGVERSLAAAVAALALVALVLLFIISVDAGDFAMWFNVISRVSLGLATLTSLMVFVERR